MVKITLPISLIEAFIKCADDKHLRIGKDGCDVDLQKLFSKLKKAGPMAIIEIYEDDVTVKAWLEWIYRNFLLGFPPNSWQFSTTSTHWHPGRKLSHLERQGQRLKKRIFPTGRTPDAGKIVAGVAASKIVLHHLKYRRRFRIFRLFQHAKERIGRIANAIVRFANKIRRNANRKWFTNWNKEFDLNMGTNKNSWEDEK